MPPTGQHPRLRHRVEYAAVAAVAWLVRTLPRPVALGCGSAIGRTAFLIDRLHRRIAIANLAAAFPQWSARELRATARGTFVHFGRLLIDLIRFGALPPDRMLAQVEFEGGDRFRHAMAHGHGVLAFTGHFGVWEIHAIAHGLEFGPIGVLARALDNPYLDAMLDRIRTGTGNHVIHRRGAVRRVLRTLAHGQCVAILIDQHIQPSDAVVVEFFGRPAYTTTALASMALRTGAPVVPVFALPLADGRYRLIYEHPVPPPPPDHPDPIREFTQRCTDVLEMYVRRYPELWLWMHRRWRAVDGGGEPPGAVVEPARPAEPGGDG